MTQISLEPFLSKARESLAGAESEIANGRFNNAVNRSYYAAYNAAIAALIGAGLISRRWGHSEVQAAFARELIHRRKFYPSALRSILYDLSTIRMRADYGLTTTGERDALNSVRNAGLFVDAVLKG